MKTTKLVAGIMEIVLSAFIVFQSMASGFVNAVEENGSASGSMGIFVALAYLITGIVYLSSKKSKKLTADSINMVILVLVGVIALMDTGIYADLLIWAWLGIIIGAGFFIWHLVVNKKSAKAVSTVDEKPEELKSK